MLFIACAFAQQSVPYLAPGLAPTTGPGTVPTIIPGIIPGLDPAGAPIDVPSLSPATTPQTVPAFTPTFAPSTFPISSNAAAAIGTCTPSCPSYTRAAAAAKGLNGQITCLLAGCTQASSRQAVIVVNAIPILLCDALVQADCDLCFWLVKCDNILGLTQAQINAIFVTCICVPTGVIGCPNCHRSKKGLLGLLGLLGLIPLILCLCLLFLCCIRRRKRQQDVHFATFDPAAANLAMPASHIAPCGPPPPCF